MYAARVRGRPSVSFLSRRARIDHLVEPAAQGIAFVRAGHFLALTSAQRFDVRHADRVAPSPRKTGLGVLRRGTERGLIAIEEIGPCPGFAARREREGLASAGHRKGRIMNIR